MIWQEDSEESVSLVPPRPNLGPEPWPERSSVLDVWLAFLGVLLIITLSLALVRRSKRRRSTTGSTSNSHHPLPDDDRGRLIVWAEAARGRLIDRFGPTWQAKTTEEIADDPILIELVDAESRASLLRLLL